MSPRVAWITGACGLIGSHLARGAAHHAPEFQPVGFTRSMLDLTDFAAVERAFTAVHPSVVIHCAAISRAAECEANPPLARHVNVEATRHLAQLAAGIPFVLFSTDLVFDGARGRYTETDDVNPLSIYAETKVAAEAIVRSNPLHSIVRTSVNAGVSPSGGRSFTEDMRAAWESGKTLSLFTDEFRCPIAAAVTARAVWELVRANQPGLYHLAGSERLSRWDIGQLLAHRWTAVTARMTPGSIRDFAGPRRAPDTSLDCSKLQALLSFPLPKFSDWLNDNPSEPV